MDSAFQKKLLELFPKKHNHPLRRFHYNSENDEVDEKALFVLHGSSLTGDLA